MHKMCVIQKKILRKPTMQWAFYIYILGFMDEFLFTILYEESLVVVL